MKLLLHLLVAAAICGVMLRAAAQDRAQTGPEGIGVRGAQLTKDGQLWLPRGAGFGAFTFAPYYTQNKTAGNLGFVGAAKKFGPGILDAAKTWKIDSIRFLVSQPGLDPQSALWSPGYLAALADGVRLCLSKGFTVIVAMQDQKHSGETAVKPLPTAETVRAWDAIGPLFANEPHVMYELFNECGIAVKGGRLPDVAPANWDLWLNGGSHGGRHFVGHQQLVHDFRQRGWRNLLIVDGPNFARVLRRNVLALEDPLGRLAYAVHPYFAQHCNSPAEWDAAFGELSAEVPVLVTEWFANSKAPFGERSYDIPQWCGEFLSYLKARRIPLWAFAFDIPSTIVRDYRGTPNDWKRFKPGGVELGSAGAGAGAMVKAHFLSLAD